LEKLKLSIIKRLYFAKAQSIAELSAAVGKSVPNITSSINQLIDSDLVIQNGLAPSTGGRRAASFALNAKALPFILSVAIDQFYSSAVILDFANRPQTKILTEQILLQNEDAFVKICSLIAKTLQQVDQASVFVIGITLPGFVDGFEGLNNSFDKSSPFYKIRENIEKEFGIRTEVENDSTAIAIAEHNFGKGVDARDVLVVNLNWGVGLGMIIDNDLYRGHSGYAGEFSHIPLSDQAKLCSCGKKGCLEVEASLVAARDFANDMLKVGEESVLQATYSQQGYITGDELLAAANAGDQLAIKAVRRIGYMLGKGIATLIHIINPEKIIISGRGAKAKRVLLPEIQSALHEFAIPRLSKNTRLEFSDTANVQLLGGGCVAVANLDKLILKAINRIIN